MAAVAGDDFVFAGLGGDHEFVGEFSAHDAGVGLDSEGAQAAALEDAGVGVEHLLVGGGAAFVGGVEGVGVLHDEFARAHEAEPRADFIAELGLDLIEVLGQLPVGTQFARHQWW